MSKPFGPHIGGAGARWGLGMAAVVLLAALGTVVQDTGARAAQPLAGAVALQELRAFRELGTVLHIAAHPDDENTQLLTYFARGRGYRTAYLSITRGDGGQNLLGPEFGEQLGVIRTQELLAARRLDGGQQFFTRAIDFGFSKSDRETLSIWDHQLVLGDVVRVIRTFRPDVVVTRFSPQPSGTHGHHTASAVLGVEAFKLAGDPQSFPEQLDVLSVWQPKRILINGGGRRGGERSDSSTTVRINVDGDDPVLGSSFGEIAGQSRAMHKSQGFGNFGGGRGGGGARSESFQLLDGEPATNDIFDGVETTWARFEGGAEVGRLTDATIAGFNSDDLASNVSALLKIRKSLSALAADPLVIEKRKQLDRILQTCLGLNVETTISHAEVVPGEPLEMRHLAIRSSTTPVRWVAVRYPSNNAEVAVGVDLELNSAARREVVQRLPSATPLSQPYWLREAGAVGVFRVNDPAMIGLPENAPAFRCDLVFEVDGQTLVIPDEPVQLSDDSGSGPGRRKLDVIAPVSLEFASEVRLFAPNATRSVEVEVEAFRSGIDGAVRLFVPGEWTVTPSTQSFRLAQVGDKHRLSFSVTAPPRAGAGEFTAEVDVNGARFNTSRIEIGYGHIPRQLLQPRARLNAVSLDMTIRGQRVGYIAGAGDSVAESLEQMGYEVSQLSGADLTPERLQKLDAVVIGVRALNTRQDLADHMPTLFAFVESGGNVIVQYNRPNGLRVNQPAPYELRLSGGRVTDENAAVQLLAPEHPALNSPNKVTEADFEGWVQERGLYFPDQWDDHFTPLVSCSDPEEAPLAGGILVANHGKGHFVYTSLAWFRQLPAGVPGAYRLFANLVSLGK